MILLRLLCLLLMFISCAAAGEHPLALLKKPGHIAIVRHALAPGTGDPADFDLGDCETQRNLSEKGRKQAQRMGKTFREAGIKDARVSTR